jgi:hypothetical protein
LHTAAKSGTVICSSIDVRITILYIWFANRFASSPFWKAIPQQILDIGMVHNYWILRPWK